MMRIARNHWALKQSLFYETLTNDFFFQSVRQKTSNSRAWLITEIDIPGR